MKGTFHKGYNAMDNEMMERIDKMKVRLAEMRGYL